MHLRGVEPQYKTSLNLVNAFQVMRQYSITSLPFNYFENYQIFRKIIVDIKCVLFASTIFFEIYLPLDKKFSDTLKTSKETRDNFHLRRPLFLSEFYIN